MWFVQCTWPHAVFSTLPFSNPARFRAASRFRAVTVWEWHHFHEAGIPRRIFNNAPFHATVSAISFHAETWLCHFHVDQNPRRDSLSWFNWFLSGVEFLEIEPSLLHLWGWDRETRTFFIFQNRQILRSFWPHCRTYPIGLAKWLFWADSPLPDRSALCFFGQGRQAMAGDPLAGTKMVAALACGGFG